MNITFVLSLEMKVMMVMSAQKSFTWHQIIQQKKTGVDICKECEDYEDNTFSKETTKKLLELGIIDSEYVEGDGCYYVDGTDEFVDIIESCLKYIVKDFEWHYRNLKEENLSKLDGVGYGLF